MFQDVWEWAGKYRKSITSIGVHPSLIVAQLSELCAEVIFWSKDAIELTFLERAARIHHRLVFIHPFENGNGRFSRLVSDSYLLAFKCAHPVWPEDLNKESGYRRQYIDSLKEADRGNHDLLLQFMRDCGARDPQIAELLGNQFYRKQLKGKQGVMLLKALIRLGASPNVSWKGHHPMQLLTKSKLEDQTKNQLLKVLIDSGANIND